MLVASVGDCQNLIVKDVKFRDDNYVDYTKGAVGAWRFDPAQDKLLDISGEDNHCVIGNDPEYISGCKEGSCYDYDGGNDYLNCGSDASLDLTNGTISFWVKLDALPSSTYWGIISKDEGGTNLLDGKIGIDHGIWADVTDDHFFMHIVSSGPANKWVESANVAIVDTWTHIVGTFGSGGMKFYINGVLEDTDASTSGWANVSEDLLIGTLNGRSRFLNGQVDEVLIDDRELTSSEILDLYKNGMK